MCSFYPERLQGKNRSETELVFWLFVVILPAP
jgi:hypothetical protein